MRYTLNCTRLELKQLLARHVMVYNVSGFELYQIGIETFKQNENINNENYFELYQIGIETLISLREAFRRLLGL